MLKKIFITMTSLTQTIVLSDWLLSVSQQFNPCSKLQLKVTVLVLQLSEW